MGSRVLRLQRITTRILSISDLHLLAVVHVNWFTSSYLHCVGRFSTLPTRIEVNFRMLLMPVGRTS